MKKKTAKDPVQQWFENMAFKPRSLKTLTAQYYETHDKVWLYRHNLHGKHDAGKESAKRIEAKYDKKSLIQDECEHEHETGKLSALAWAIGIPWEISRDT